MTTRSKYPAAAAAAAADALSRTAVAAEPLSSMPTDPAVVAQHCDGGDARVCCWR